MPLTKFFHGIFFPAHPIQRPTPAARLRWLLLSSGYLVFSYLIATLIPDFAAFQGLIGALVGAPILFGFPAFFFILASRKNDHPISTLDKVLCAAFVFVFLPLFTILGTTESVIAIIDTVAHSAAPFTVCIANPPAGIATV